MHLLDFLPPVLRGVTFDMQDLFTLTIFGMTIIQVVPIKINPWSAIARWLGSVLNADINRKVDTLSEDIKQVRDENEDFRKLYEQNQAIIRRYHIVRFGDEISRGIDHSEENFQQVLSDIDEYERYCASHPNFKNNQTVVTTKLIVDTYQERLKKRDFI